MGTGEDCGGGEELGTVQLLAVGEELGHHREDRRGRGHMRIKGEDRERISHEKGGEGQKSYCHLL